jgi:hypothetical protein
VIVFGNTSSGDTDSTDDNKGRPLKALGFIRCSALFFHSDLDLSCFFFARYVIMH